MSVSWTAGQASLANTSCAHIRNAFMIYRSIFNRDVVWTESVPSEQVDDMLDLLRDFRDIICLLYSDMYTRSPSLVVSLHVRTWMFQRRCLRVLPTAPALYSLPFHQLCCHLPSLSRDYFLVDLTTESFEALWKNLRGVENGSNHRGDMPWRCLWPCITNKSLLTGSARGLHDTKRSALDTGRRQPPW